jgi:hypothetical protein
METEIRLYKRKINNSLQSIKVMLMNKKRTLPKEEWLMLVDKIKVGIISKPHQYIDINLPPQETVTSLVEDIFEQFLEDQKSRS